MQQKSEELLRMIPGQFNILAKIRLQSMNVKSSLPALYIELALRDATTAMNATTICLYNVTYQFPVRLNNSCHSKDLYMNAES